MATPEDIIEARRIASAKAMAQSSAKTPSTTNALSELQASIAASKKQVQAKNIEIPTIALEQAVSVGDTAAAREAALAVAKAKGLQSSAATQEAINLLQQNNTKPVLTPEQVKRGDRVVWQGGLNGYWQVIMGKNVTPSDDSSTGGDNLGGGTIFRFINGILYANGSPFTGNYQGKVYQDGRELNVTGSNTAGSTATSTVGTASNVPLLAKDIFKQTLAMFFGAGDASKPWMDELYNVVSKFYRSGASVDESLNMALLDSRNNPNLKEFTDRFKGIYSLMDMKQAGKPVTIPTIAEYVSSQSKMADLLTQANLGALATTEYTGDLIGKGNSVSTIADKIANVFNRIDLAPKDVKDTLSRYFPAADRLKLAGALLQGEKGVTQLVDELAKYEVLAAAEAQGVGALGARAKAGGVTEERAQQYARAGGTYQSLLPKFGQVAAVTPVISKLSGVSGVTDIGQAGVEKALILSGEAERAAIEKLSAQEEARFAAKAGRMEQGLASQRRANRAF